jgi:L-lactate dehydrogenase complex protein LldG
MTEKEKILSRIQEALKVPAPVPGAHEAQVHPPAFLNQDPRSWLPSVGKTFEERLALFQKNSADLKTEFQLLDNFQQVCTALLALRDTEGWKLIGTHSGELTDPACRALGLPSCRTDQPYDTAELEKCEVGVTECEALLAQTGSVLVTNRSAGGRALSVLPPHHVVLARREQLLPDLSNAFALLKAKYQNNYPSFISFITGPSRTGDIERVLVLGAHGPKKLTILLF